MQCPFRQSSGLRLALAAWLLGIVLLETMSGAQGGDGGTRSWTVTKKLYHLGNRSQPKWRKFTSERPYHHRKLELTFDVRELGRVRALEIRSGDVREKWKVELNDEDLGVLRKGDEERRQYFDVDGSLLKRRKNQLVIKAAKGNTDDIYVGHVVLHERPSWKLMGLAEVDVDVTEAASGDPLPCRLTVTRTSPEGKEELFDMRCAGREGQALRGSVLYTLDGRGRLFLSPGEYRLYASRGFEYGVASKPLRTSAHGKRRVSLVLDREVDTTGYLAADTHVHTYTYSRHGDASVEERVVTIAAEGVEIAVATDHNHHTDYRPVARSLAATKRFLPVIGNEFTTDIGHFGAFPIEAGSKPAKHTHKDWGKLLRALRDTPGVRVVICNHPRRHGFSKGPFGRISLNPVSGELPREPFWLGFDAVEVVNARTLEKNAMPTFGDWFALLNRGYRLAAVAASDSHSVLGIVGQARTYVKSKSDDPKRIDIREIIESFLEGRVLVSLGLLVDIRVAGRFGVGDLATGIDGPLEVEITVSGPRWSRADQVTLYLNGEKIRSGSIRHGEGAIVKYSQTWRIPRPAADAHLVVMATGPPISAPFWPLREKDRYVLAATNPVWIDGDGDGRFSCAYEYAVRLVEHCGTDAEKLREELRGYDTAVRIQAASLVRSRLVAGLQAAYERMLTDARKTLDGVLSASDARAQKALDAYRESRPNLDAELRSGEERKKEGNK